jgi:hypothetical protein
MNKTLLILGLFLLLLGGCCDRGTPTVQTPVSESKIPDPLRRSSYRIVSNGLEFKVQRNTGPDWIDEYYSPNTASTLKEAEERLDGTVAARRKAIRNWEPVFSNVAVDPADLGRMTEAEFRLYLERSVAVATKTVTNTVWMAECLKCPKPVTITGAVTNAVRWTTIQDHGLEKYYSPR